MSNKRRKIGKGKKKNRYLLYLREEMVRLIDGKEINDLSGKIVSTRKWGYGGGYSVKSNINWGNVVKNVLEKNESEKFRKLLMKRKKKIYKKLGSFFTTYIFNDPQNQIKVDDNDDEDDEKEEKLTIPKQMQDRVFQLVHYFYHGMLPLDKRLKTFAALRREEKEVLGEYDMTDFVNIEFFFDDNTSSLTIPRDVFWEILSFIPHDYENLVRIGLVNEKFFVSFLYTWYNLKIYPGEKVKQISLLVLKNAKNVSFIDKKSFRKMIDNSGYYYQWWNRPSSSVDVIDQDNTSSSFNSGSVKYLFSQLTLRRITVLDFSNCSNISSFMNLIRSIFCQKLVFPLTTKIIFPEIAFNIKYEDDENDISNDNSPYTLKRLIYSTAYKYVLSSKQPHVFTPNIHHVENASIESMMLFPHELIRNQIRYIKLFLFRKDSSILNGCGFDFSQCRHFCVYPREILQSSYMEKIFEKIVFRSNSDHQHKSNCFLTIGISSNDEQVVLSKFNSPFLSNNIQCLTLDFEANGAVTSRHTHASGFHSSYDIQNLIFQNGVKVEKIRLLNFTVDIISSHDVNRVDFLFDTKFPENLKEFEIIFDDGSNRVNRNPGEYNSLVWRNSFQNQKTVSFNRVYPKGLNIQERIYKFTSEMTIKMIVKTQTIEIVISKKSSSVNNNPIIGEDLLFVLVNLSNSLCESNSVIQRGYRYINVIYTSTGKYSSKQRKCLFDFLKEYFSLFCDISENLNSPPPTIIKKKKKKKNKKKPLEKCKICISQIGNPERTKIRETALKLGGTYSPQFDTEVTHLIVPMKKHARKNGVDKVESALDNNSKTYVVTCDWIYECEDFWERVEEDAYRLFSNEEIIIDDDDDDDEDDDDENKQVWDMSDDDEEEEKEDRGIKTVVVDWTNRYEVNLKVRNFNNKKKKSIKKRLRKKQKKYKKKKEPCHFVPKSL